MSEREQEVVAQKMIPLPFLDDEVPALYLADGRPYIPVFAVCHALGIRADTHIRRWRHLVLWFTARKLPFLYSLFDWKLVTPLRRLQLRRATEEQVKLANLAYQTMQYRYRTMRQALFTFLTTCADIDAFLQRYAATMLPALDDESALALAALLDRGRSLFQEATTHARKMVHEQGMLPVVDAVKIDAQNNVIDTFSMPLLPIVSQEDSEHFFALMGQLTTWMQEERAFWAERGDWPSKGQAN